MRLTEHRLTIPNALAEIETALIAVQNFDDRIGRLEVAFEQSTTAFRQSNALYRDRLTSLSNVLDA